MKTPKEEIRRVEAEFFKTISTLIVSAFSLVAALAWNTAITKILEDYLSLSKPDSGIASWIIYAVIVTLLAVIVTVYVGRLAERLSAKHEKQVEQEESKK